MGTQKLYPRGTVKRIVKAHANRNVSKNADILVSYCLDHIAVCILQKWVADLFNVG